MQYLVRFRTNLAVVTLTLALLLLWVPTASAFTDPLRGAVESELANLFQGPIHIGEVSLANLSCIAVTDVVVYDPANPRERMLEIKEINIKYSLMGLLFNLDNLGKALREIVLKEPKLTIARDEHGWNVYRLAKSVSGDGQKLNLEVGVEGGEIVIEKFDDYLDRVVAKVEGTMSVNGADMSISHLGVEAFDVKLMAKGDIKNRELDVVMSAKGFELQKLMSHFPQVSDLLLSATGSVTVSAKGPVTNPRIFGTVEALGGKIGLPKVSNYTYEIDEAYASFTYDSGTIMIDRLIVEAGEGLLTGTGKAMALGEIDLAVTGKDIDFSKYLPIAARARIYGPVQFSGRVFGNLQNPVFRADISKESGTFFEAPVDEVRGQISADLRQFAFHGVRIRKGKALAEMNGSITYGVGSTVQMDVVVTGVEADDLLQALNIPDVATGTVTGRLAFQGPLESMAATGDIRMADGTYLAQEFDTAYAKFAVTPGGAEISDAALWIDGGKVAFSGKTVRPGELQLTIAADAVPLDRVKLFDGIETGVAGIVSFVGSASVTGSLTSPHAKLKLDLTAGERMALGPKVRLDFNYSSSQVQRN